MFGPCVSALHPAALIIQEALCKISTAPVSGMSSVVPRRLLAERRNSSLSREQLGSWRDCCEELSVHIVYANFDQCVEIGDDGTKPST